MATEFEICSSCCPVATSSPDVTGQAEACASQGNLTSNAKSGTYPQEPIHFSPTGAGNSGRAQKD